MMKKKIGLTLSTVMLGSLLMLAGMAYANGFSGWPTLSKGSSGGYVSGLQASLYAMGQQPSVGAVDGIFGTGTETGLINFQTNTGLVADGIAGSNTWSEFHDWATFETYTLWYLDTSYSSTYWTSFALTNNETKLTYRVSYKGSNTSVYSGTVY